jgi:hypothetical protein
MAQAPLVLTWLRAVAEDRDLSKGATALAALLVKYANADGTSCRPGDERLRTRLKVKKRALISYRRELRQAGLLVASADVVFDVSAVERGVVR